MTYIYLLYGLAFIAMGIVLGVQARLPFSVLPRRALALLSMFALVHGVSEWLSMVVLIEHPRQLRQWQVLIVTLNALSFGLLWQFAVELWRRSAGKPRWVQQVSGFLTIAAVIAVAPAAWAGGDTEPAVVEAVVRYTFALSASIFAAFALLAARRASKKRMTARSRQLLVVGSLSFAAYGVLAGLIVPPAPFIPASHLNTEWFRSLTGIPVQILRALCAVVMASTLT